MKFKNQAEYITKLRAANNLTLRELSEKLEVRYQFVQSLEKGRVGFPVKHAHKLESLKKFSKQKFLLECLKDFSYQWQQDFKRGESGKQ